MEVQLRRYLIKQGRLDQFITEWKAAVVPLREKFGFTLLGAWSLPESNEFVWVIGYEGDFKDADLAYYESANSCGKGNLQRERADRQDPQHQWRR